MKLLARAIVTGFGLSLGSAIFKKVAARFGFAEDEKEKDRINAQDGATDPGLRHKFS